MAKPKKTQPVHTGSMNYTHIAVIIILSAAVFANSLPGNFVWDDEIQVVKNWRIRSFENLPSASVATLVLDCLTVIVAPIG